MVYAVHENPANPHIHIVMNSVSYVDGHRYYGTKKEHYDLMKVIKHSLLIHGIYKLHIIAQRLCNFAALNHSKLSPIFSEFYLILP